MATWKLVCPDGLWTSAQLFYKGEAVSAFGASINVQAGEVVTATFTVEDVEVEIGGLPAETLGHPLNGQTSS